MKKLIPIFLLLIAISCSEESLKTSDESQFDSSNILSFKDGDEAFSYFQNAKKLSPNGFKSIQSEFLSVTEKLAALEDESAHSKLLDENKNLVRYVDYDYLPVMENVFYRVVCNLDRMYISNNLVHKVMDNYNIVFTDKKFFSELKALESVDNLDTKIFSLAPYKSAEEGSESGRSKALCGSYVEQDYFKNLGGCNNDRRVWVSANASFVVSGYMYRPTVIAQVYGQERRSSCNWNRYDNIWHSKNCSFTASVAINGSIYSYPETMADYDTPGPGYEPEHVMWNAYVGPAMAYSGGPTPSIQFSAIHLEGSSQGVDSSDPTHWAVINCQ